MREINFKDLNLEEKRDYIRRLLSPIIENTREWKRNLETFVFWASEEKLDKFYNAIMTWDKEYAKTVANDIKIKKWEINKLRTDFSMNIMEYKEAEEKQENEINMDEQLASI